MSAPEVIVGLGMATDEEIAQALSVQLGIPCIELKHTPVEPHAIDLITEKVARKHFILPISIEQKDLHLAMTDPLSFEAFEDVRFASGYTIRPAIGTRSDILWGIDQHYHLGSSLNTIVKAIASGMMTPARGALDKAKAGIATLEEMYRVVETEEEFGTTCPKCDHALGAGFVMCP